MLELRKVWTRISLVRGLAERRMDADRWTGSPIMSLSLSFPGQAFLKASLFDEIPPPAVQVHTDNQNAWLHVDERAPASH